ncbi:MAG: hypothetical protein LBU99_01020 [Spirochaetaceae bacterium]|jgi:hypothetical protein|nr:hypothetical protein [Spirochaetaceae bacterium]
MKNIYVFFVLFLVNTMMYSQEDNSTVNDDYSEFDEMSGITIYGELPEEFAPESIEAAVLDQLNESPSARKQFIETELLEKSGFRRTGTVRYRKTDGKEKVLSVLSGFGNLFSFGMAPIKSFREVEYGKLPKGMYYPFESVMLSSQFADISPDVWNILKLEYMLQIEFCHGIVMQDNVSYYTDKNIEKFETLVLKLPDYPESVLEAKTRFLNELVRIKRSFERRRNPSESQKAMQENFRNMLRME